jgi:hypothetical protein
MVFSPVSQLFGCRRCNVQKIYFFICFANENIKKKLTSKVACFSLISETANKPRYITTLTSIERKKWEHYKEVGLKRTTW